MASARNPHRRIAFIGSLSLCHQHDGCQAQGKGGVSAGAIFYGEITATEAQIDF
jgi:hypothetical protein